jgi:FkbM family methyltransferase
LGAGLRFDAAGGQPGYLLGTSEPAEQAFLAANLRPGGVFYDVGANIGFFATLAARLVGPSGHVYAFEPFPASAALVARNAELNGFQNVTVVEAAASDRGGRMPLAISSSGSQKHRLGTGPGLEVDVVAIDEWAATSGARRPTVVMIDVEGAELQVLAGMHDLLAAQRPVICCEVHWLGEEVLEFHSSTLAPLGYELRQLDGTPPPPPADRGRWHALLTPHP